ncbi:AraC family transcriptional regulator N-terminal domain-containing protein [Ferruginibacter yonginensis]|uniref:AraC family transcriptional regulator N-terminal domain-containing protein n=1 Tax=Ferruginibacter yonginensis TaxID=1310416 RepID=A0ABV8QQL9_9BACT
MLKHKLKNMPDVLNEKSLKTLVENRQIFSLNNCEMNVFETHQQAYLVPLKFNDFVITSMLRGKKVMHLFDEPGFDYLPGETVIVPSNVAMKIDFPEATAKNPTQCLALAIDQNRIDETIAHLNNKYNHHHPWKLDHNRYFFYNNEDLANTITKLLAICTSAKPDKDIFADLALQELIIRIIQSQNLQALQQDEVAKTSTNSNFSAIVAYIKNNLFKKINLKTLTSEACMSSPSLYRLFKKEIGMSPIEFIMVEKVQVAKKLLQNPYIHINEVCYQAGFDDCNYFIRMFKKLEGVTPKQYQMLLVHKA